MRHKWTATSDFDLYEEIRRLSEITRILISRLCDEAIEDLLIKYNFEKLDSKFKAKGK